MTTNPPADLLYMNCKKLCVERCLRAIVYSLASQFMLLMVFLLFINFSFLHPIVWVTETLSTLLSVFTWICMVPLLSFIVLYGICLGKFYMHEQTYSPTRFSQICKSFTSSAVFLLVHMFLGFLTAWLYSKWLQNEYKYFYYKCYENKYCINEKHTFIVLNGIYISICYFFRQFVGKQKKITFPIIQQSHFIEIKTNFYSVLLKSLKEAIIPTLGFVASCYIIGDVLVYNVTKIFNLQIELNSSVIDLQLVWYLFVISLQILSNMYFIDFLFNIFLTEHKQFPIESNATAVFDTEKDVTLVEALSAMKTPIVQQLAALDLYNMSLSNKLRRKQVYALSVPGGHPHNWKMLSSQCLFIITEYRNELSKSIDHLYKSNPTIYYKSMTVKNTATNFADKIRQRQHNESFGIRNMTSQQTTENSNEGSGSEQKKLFFGQRYLKEYLENVKLKMQNVQVAILNAPGIHFLFAEPDCQRVGYLLSGSQMIGWVVLGIAQLACCSLKEDSYGVVQTDLRTIIKSLLELKLVLDKVSTCNIIRQSNQLKCVSLKSSVRRSLCNLAYVFSDYLPELTSVDDLKTIQHFANFREF